MRPFTFICILSFTTAAIILVCSFVDQKYGSPSASSSSSAPSAEPLLSKHEKYSKDKQKAHPMKVKAEKKHEAGKKFLTLAEGKVPAFEDVFDEETFYIFAGCVALGSIVLAFIASRFLTLSDPDDPDEILKQVRKWKIKHTEQGHPIMDDAATTTATASAADGSSSDAAAAAEAASSEDSQKAKDAKERSFLDYTDDDDDDDEDDFDNSEGDDSEEERELLRRVEEKFFRDRRQAPNVEATMG